MWLDLDPGKVEIGNHSSRVGGCRAHISSRAGGLLKCVEVCLFFLSPSKDRTGVDRLNRYTHLTGPPPRHYFHKIPPPHKEKVNFLWPWWSFSPFNSHFFPFLFPRKKGLNHRIYVYATITGAWSGILLTYNLRISEITYSSTSKDIYVCVDEFLPIISKFAAANVAQLCTLMPSSSAPRVWEYRWRRGGLAAARKRRSFQTCMSFRWSNPSIKTHEDLINIMKILLEFIYFYYSISSFIHVSFYFHILSLAHSTVGKWRSIQQMSIFILAVDTPH